MQSRFFPQCGILREIDISDFEQFGEWSRETKIVVELTERQLQIVDRRLRISGPTIDSLRR